MNTIADCCGICMNQLMLGTCEVPYFIAKIGTSRQSNGFSMVGDEEHCVS